MTELKIGVMVESFKLSTRAGIVRAAEVGAQGIQMYTLGETHPDQLSRAERQALLHYIQAQGLVVSALCGDFGGFGLEKAAANHAKIPLIKKALEMAVDFETRVLTTHIGAIPTATDSPVYQTLLRACYELAEYASHLGVTFAIETGPEKSTTLKQFIENVGSAGLGVNFDPANLRMVTGEDSIRAAENLKASVVHTHAKDGIQLREIEPVKIYHCFAGENPDGLNPDDYFKEVPLGQGQVDFGYIRVLRQAGYAGFYTIEREVGANPFQDIQDAVQFLKKLPVD